jgi:serine phosphatase RsbU (regulator of sigma subunit)
MFTDGLVHAGSRYGESMDVPSSLQALLEDEDPGAQMIADSILEMAVHLDRGRPADDISLAVMRATASESDKVRRMTIRLPISI